MDVICSAHLGYIFKGCHYPIKVLEPQSSGGMQQPAWVMSQGLQGASSLLLRSRGPGVAPLTAVVDLCKLWAFTLPDHSPFLFLFSCQGPSSRSGEVYVVRELGRKFSRPNAPPFLPSHHPHMSWVIIWWGKLVEGEGQEEERGESLP